MVLFGSRTDHAMRSAARWVFIWYCIFQGCLMSDITSSGWFWHVSDIHYDFSFDSQKFSCNKKMEDSAPYGNYWCDAPWRLVEDSFRAMTSIRPDVDFVLWTGDNVPHIDDEHFSTELTIAILTNLTLLLNQTFPTVPVFPTLGNHDYFPTSQLPPSSNAVYDAMANLWSEWIKDTQQLNNFRRGAFYTIKTSHGLRIVALNTNLFYNRNKMVVNETDPAGQLAWLTTTLTTAERMGEKVLLIEHVGPGVFTPDDVKWMYPRFHEHFLTILRDYSHVIIGIHAGHQHEDAFKVITTLDGKPAIPVFFAPSLTPWRYVSDDGKFTGPAHNPAIRLVEYDRITGRQLNIVQYYTNLTSSNLDNRTNWKQVYDFKMAFDVSDVSALSLHKLIEKIKRPDGREYFDKYFKFTTAKADRDEDPTCSVISCKCSVLCGFDNIDYTNYTTCVEDCIKNVNTSSGSAVKLIAQNIHSLLLCLQLLLVACSI